MALLGNKPQYNMAGGAVPQQGQGFDIQGLLGNPLLHAGVGLLGSQKGQGAQAALQGLMQGQQVQQSFADRKKQEDQAALAAAKEAKLQELSASLPGLFQEGGVGAITPALLGNPETMNMGLKAAGVGAGSQSIPASLQELTALQSMTPEQQDQFWRVKRAQQTFGAGGVQYGIDPRTQGVSALVDPNQIAQTAADIKGAQTLAAVQAQNQGAVEAKNPVMESFNISKSNMLAQIDNVPTGGILGARGKVSRVTNYQGVRAFENAKQQMSTDLRAALRIPGEGTLSDKEQEQYNLNLPDINNDPELNREIVNVLEQRMAARMPASGATGQQSSGGIPTPKNQAEYDSLPSGAVFINDDGKKYRKP